MTAISQETAEQKLAMWLEALDKIAAKQSYSINGRTLTHADLSKVEEQIRFWERRVIKAQRGGIRMRQVIPNG